MRKNGVGFEEHGFEAITVTVSVREGGERGKLAVLATCMKMKWACAIK